MVESPLKNFLQNSITTKKILDQQELKWTKNRKVHLLPHLPKSAPEQRDVCLSTRARDSKQQKLQILIRNSINSLKNSGVEKSCLSNETST
uniref:Uncharacterized protein n=1 Tax=Megaselia scalaris TaxID=36166 RepID=T1H292_MEGSC